MEEDPCAEGEQHERAPLARRELGVAGVGTRAAVDAQEVEAEAQRAILPEGGADRDLGLLDHELTTDRAADPLGRVRAVES